MVCGKQKVKLHVITEMSEWSKDPPLKNYSGLNRNVHISSLQ